MMLLLKLEVIYPMKLNDINEDELWRRFKKEKDSEARELLIMKYAGLVKYVMDRLSLNPPSTVQYDDLYNCGIIGLISAVDGYDLKYGTKFQTYAIWRIRGEILDESKRMGWLPRTLYRKRIEIEKTYVKLENEFGRSVEDIEVAEKLDMDLDELHHVITECSRASFLSLYDLVKEGDNDNPIYLIDLIKDPDISTSAIVEQNELNDTIAKAIDELPHQEKLVVALYYKEELTLKEIGKILNVTESRVSQINSQAIIHIRSKLYKLGLVDFPDKKNRKVRCNGSCN